MAGSGTAYQFFTYFTSSLSFILITPMYFDSTFISEVFAFKEHLQNALSKWKNG
jgi:hypothetical protein